MNVAVPCTTGLAGSAPRSNSCTSTVRSGDPTGTSFASRNENISRVLPQAMVPPGLISCGNTDGCCDAMSQPSGMPCGAGVVGHAAAPGEPLGGGVDEPGGELAGEPGPAVQAATARRRTARIAVDP